jgi:hypothetical protein
MKISRYWKAVVTALAAGSGSLTNALNVDGVVTSTEGLTVGLAILAALGVTWAVPNRESKGLA